MSVPDPTLRPTVPPAGTPPDRPPAPPRAPADGTAAGGTAASCRRRPLVGLLGAWLLTSLAGGRSALFDATVALMPAEAAARWRHDRQHDPVFRRIFRALTVGWGAAFLFGAAARVVTAYTLPVDAVPAAAAALLLVLLVAVVQAGRAYGRRHLGPPVTPGTGGRVPAGARRSGRTERTGR